MSTRHAQVWVAAGLVGVLAATPVRAQRPPQRNPIFVVTTFRSLSEPQLGIEAATVIRDRMTKLFPQPPRSGALRVVRLSEINAQLTASSFPTDSALTTLDLQNLGRQMGASESMEGTVVRSATGVKLTAKFYSLSNTGAAEILPVVEEKDVGAAGRKLADLYAKAREELPDYEQCRQGVIYGEADKAIVAANAAFKKWDKGVLPLACLMTAYQIEVKANRMPVDSVIRVGEQIMRADPDNEIAMGALSDAYRAQGTVNRWVPLAMRLYQQNPANIAQALSIVAALAASGAPDRALPIIRQLRQSNPGDVDILDMEWRIEFSLNQWTDMIGTGREMVKFDSSRADTMYFRRQTLAARAASQPADVLRFLADATGKFPNDARRWLEYSQELRQRGQLREALDAAKRSVAINSSVGGIPEQLYLLIALGERDSAIAFAKHVLAGGADSAKVAASLLTLIDPLQKAAQASNARGDWEETLRVAATVDSAAPSLGSKFFFGLSAAQIAFSALNNVSALQTSDRAKACAELKVATAMLDIAEANIHAGGRFLPDAAGNILTIIGKQRPNLPQYARAVCPRPEG